MIASERIRLLPPSLGLVDEFHQALNESYSELCQFLPWVKANQSRVKTFTDMELAMEKFAAHRDELRFIIEERQQQRIVGCIGLILRDLEVPYYEIGYWVRSSERGRGYITEAVNLLSSYAGAILGARRLEIRVSGRNQRSRAVAERCGYRLEAILHQSRRTPDGQLDDTLVFCRLDPGLRSQPAG